MGGHKFSSVDPLYQKCWSLVMLRSSLKIRLPRCAFKTVVCFKSSYNENDTVSTQEMTFSCYVRAFEHPHLYHAPPDPNQRPIKFIYMKVIKIIWFFTAATFWYFRMLFYLIFHLYLIFSVNGAWISHSRLQNGPFSQKKIIDGHWMGSGVDEKILLSHPMASLIQKKTTKKIP